MFLHILHNGIHGLVRNCTNSSALAVELLQFCTKPSICCSNTENTTSEMENNIIDIELQRKHHSAYQISILVSFQIMKAIHI